ncbi:MAG TPA: DEAD/DEAH box helicase family protein [Propionicimonas sp.]
MSGYYQRPDVNFAYWPGGQPPRWRDAQLGALGSLLSHWSVRPTEPALLSMPTGSGKSAIANAIPYLCRAHRVLVVVPSQHLRDQLTSAFATQDVLRAIGALSTTDNPVVHEVCGLVQDWKHIEAADVVVALPQSISPGLYDPRPPADLFDLVIMDEAHHAPAASWQAILDHYASARRVLLTATPKRRDGQRVPGEPVYHYPLAKAIAEGIYKPVRAALLTPGPAADVNSCDAMIRDEVLQVLKDPDHASSTLLIRASTADRAQRLARLYSEAGRPTVALTNRLNGGKQAQIVAGLRDGSVKSVAVVSMLGEGFDLPSFRVVAYHDKHRSMAATTQLIGRLVRVSPEFPQESVLVAVRDIDVFPALQGAVRALYEEDAEWEQLLPGVIDAEAENTRRERDFMSHLELAPNELSLSALRVPVRATVYETHEVEWLPDFATAMAEFEAGSPVAGGSEVFYATLTPQSHTMLVVTRSVESPRWHAHPGLDSLRFDLHVVTWAAPRLRGQAGLLLLNSTDADVRRLLLDRLGTATAALRGADPERLHGAFDALTRLSVSNVGVRNTNVGARRGTASYKMFAGSGVDRGLREADTTASAIGHAMAQVSLGPGLSAYNAGIAVEKAKMWESRYLTVLQYEEAIADFVARYRSSHVSANPLLPDVSRGFAVTEFPEHPVAFVEWHPGIIGEWDYNSDPLESLDLQVDSMQSTANTLMLELRQEPDDPKPLWQGKQTLDGEVSNVNAGLLVRRGYATKDLAALLTEFPATIRYQVGSSIVGRVTYERPGVSTGLAYVDRAHLVWTGVNLTKETDDAAQRAGAGMSVQACVRAHLIARTPKLPHRWVLDNDGKGEIADLIVVETDAQGQVHLELWHVKPSSSTTPGVRVTDVQVVCAQAAKSRRWFTDDGFFGELRDRYRGAKAPRARLIDGDEDLLQDLLGDPTAARPWTLTSARPVVRGDVVIAQPGLSWSELEAKLAVGDLAAQQTRDLLTVVGDAIGSLADVHVVGSA